MMRVVYHNAQLKTYDLAPVSVNTPSPPANGDRGENNKSQNIQKNEDKIQFNSKSSTNPQGLSEEKQKQIAKLKRRDRVVRAHEQAHIAAGGPYVRGGAHYVYQRGPDGKLYAIGGEVSIDVSPVPDDPKATIRKMQVVKRAALAPAQPSAQDYHIAAQATMEIQKAQAELNRMKAEEAYNYNSIQSNNYNRSSGSLLSLIA